MGTAGIALALAAFGGMSIAARKFLPQSESGPVRVLGRTSLSPKHAVYLLKAGDKVLIVGTGPQGSPTLLGEMPPESAGGAS
jgi:flagellar biogenesis protein FliO